MPYKLRFSWENHQWHQWWIVHYQMPALHVPKIRYGRKKKDYSLAVMHPQVPWTSQWSSGSIKLDNWLVVGLPLWKIWKSVGMMTFPIYGKIKMFQTTNQIISQEVSARFELHSMASPISMTIYIYNYIMMKLNSIIHQKMCVCV